jgi:hypothetical protein
MFVVCAASKMMLLENIILQSSQTPSRLPNRITQSSCQPQREAPELLLPLPQPQPHPPLLLPHHRLCTAIGVRQRYALPDTWKRDKNFLCVTKPENSEFDWCR